MNWGKWIIISFILFAVFIGTLATICMREDVNLVSKNYYEEELKYESQIQRINNTTHLTEKPVINVSNRILEIQFGATSAPEHGTLKLFRPSDMKFDRNFSFRSGSLQKQQFDLTSSPAGMYHVFVQWTMNGTDFYLEKSINL